MVYKNLKHIFIFSLILIFSFTLITGCGSSKSSEELETIRLCEVVHSIFYAPQYVAISQGFFKEEGLNIELTTGQGADKVMTALLSDSADIGLAGPEATIYIYNQGKKDYIVNFAQLTKRDGSFLVGKKEEADFKIENLKGKTIIGGRPGGVPEMTLEYILKQHNLIPGKDINIITNLQFTATAGAFKGGTGDYVALFEPTASIMEQQNAGKVVASLGELGGEIPYTVFMAKKSYIEKNPEIIQKFTNAVYKSQQWIEENSSMEVAQAIQTYFPDADLNILTKVVERYREQDTWDKNPILEEKSLDNLQTIIKEARELDKYVPSVELIDNTFAKKAME